MSGRPWRGGTFGGWLVDAGTLGPARRRRRMRRLLRRIDRLDARASAQASPSAITGQGRWGVAYGDTAGTGRSQGRSRGAGHHSPGRELLALGVVTVLVTSGLLWVRHDAKLPDLDRLTASWSGERPPIPADASAHRLLPVVTPPRGEGGYRYLRESAQGPAAYDPCRPIHIVVNKEQAPDDADRIVAAAVGRVSGATGLRFVLDGPTTELATDGRPPIDRRRYGRTWSPVLLAWTTPERIPRLAGRIAGLGGSVIVESPRGRLVNVSGIVYVDGPDAIQIEARDPQGRSEVEAIVMHELGHLVGLNHVDDPNQLMAPENSGRLDFGPGDLRGLAAVGRGECNAL